MFKTTIKIDGMMCGMCEAHISDVLRKTVQDAKKVSASHTKGQAKPSIDDTAYLQSGTTFHVIPIYASGELDVPNVWYPRR